MNDNNQKEGDLSNIKLKTLLIYPPEYSSPLPYPPLGIPQLNAFLNNKNYKNLNVVDLRFVIQSKLKSVLTILTNYFYKKISNSAFIIANFNKPKIKKILNLFDAINKSLRYSKKKEHKKSSPFSWSLDSIINTAVEYTQYNKYKICRYIESLIKKEKQDLVGFSVIFPEQLFYSLIISKMLKSFNKDIFIVMGGAQITKHINYLIKKEELSNFVDGFIVDDGEEPLAELIYQLEHSRNFKKVPNLYFKNKNNRYSKSKYIFSCNSRYILTPNFDEFPCSSLPLRISFGCLWGQCTFCTYYLSHQKYSRGNVKQIIEIIKNLKKKYKISQFYFVDDWLPPAFLREFSEALIKEDFKILWSCSIALVPGFDESLTQTMAKSGCTGVDAGLESMSPRIVELINKPHNPELAKKILKQFKESGILVTIHVIFGFPTETKEEALITLNFLKHNKEFFNAASIQQFSLEEGTIIFKEPQKYGISKIYTEDKNYGIRLGYRYEVNTGMSQEESRLFTEKAIETPPNIIKAFQKSLKN